MARFIAGNPGLWFSTGNPSTVNDAAPVFQLGQLGSFDVNMSDITIPAAANGIPTGHFPRVWQYVQLKATSATPAFGQVVTWDDPAGSPGFVVTTSVAAANRNRPAGIVVNASATLGNYIWILVSGVGPGLSEGATTPAAGGTCIVGGTTAGRVDTIAAATAPTHVNLGTYLGAKTVAFGSSSTLPTDTCAILFDFPLYGCR